MNWLQHRPQLKILASILADRTCQEGLVQYSAEYHERVILRAWRVPTEADVHTVTSHRR